MSACPGFGADGPAGIGPALRIVDCMTGEAAATAFSRLFGQDGRLLTALTMLLTVYVAIAAIGLLTGRTRIGIATLTPRMLTLGLVLTFATSWAAYQATVWNLATGAPDQIAGTLIGAHGSATNLFADRLDELFTSVADAAQAAAQPAGSGDGRAAPVAATVGGFSASTVLWVSALMLLLGTVCVLLTAKIVLAALLALGPVFIVLALFDGTRGLFEGWMKGVVLFALVPLLTVLIGGATLAMIAPLARGIGMAGAQPDPRPIGALFVAACVYDALMGIVIVTASRMVAGWRLPFSREPEARGGRDAAVTPLLPATPLATAAAARGGDERVHTLVASLPANDERVVALAGIGGGSTSGSGSSRRIAAPLAGTAAPLAPVMVADQRVGGMRRIGARPPAPAGGGLS